MRLVALALVAAMAAPFIAPVPADAASEPSVRIARAFIQLGMERKTAQCYGAVIGEELDGDKLVRAAKIVETAKDADDVRESVSDSGLGMINAFSHARNRCERGQGS